MKDDSGIARIAIVTLAIMMIAVPIAASIASDAPTRRIAETPGPSAVSQDEVLALAKVHGLDRLSDIAFEDGVWSVAGAAKNGSPIRLSISSAGEILNRTS